ncbi:bifunctional metallophosphatase/5'-nucleotidase [Liquorilactobacillus uvarum]|uniref:Metallophosphoesterase n=1 Tax=Liquorilactobacillus uvarum DSM 19971 TaxID=1423812 RepID=A0A0R1PY00_9LACO|nr:bifunctional metallophosphatase/5'-nucleotidase [Liquorilactobacillus uvarum]KRL37345.1 metallophosphoesterase [Liquorilactobacillus uvarum DSM 19971]
MNERITILHTNDIHSHFENWPKIRRYLIGTRRQLREKGETVITVDLGDAMDRVHPLSEATNGKINIELMNKIGYDAATVGNNEGIGNSHEQLNAMYDDAEFPIVLDNIINKRTRRAPQWAESSKIITTDKGVKIGLLACTAPFSATYRMNDWIPLEVDDVLPNLLKRIRPKVDVLVLMSHLGIDVDRAIASKYPEFDVILGSHTHHLLEHGEKIGQTILCAAGKWGRYIGQVTLNISDHKIVDKKAEVVKTASLSESSGDATEIERYQKEGESLLREKKVAVLPKDYPGSWVKRSLLMNVSLKAIQFVTQTEASILNGGLFLDDLHQGVLTRYDLHHILPHPMRIVKVRLNGYNLWRLIREMEKNRNHLRNSIVKGNGFRGKVFGELVYDGIEFDPLSKSVSWHGQILDPGADYEIATVDNFIYCPFFPTLEIVGHPKYIGDRFLRDVVGDYFGAKYPV